MPRSRLVPVCAVLLVVALLSGSAHPQDARPEPIRLGVGDHVYEWDTAWGKTPDGSDLGNTHGGLVVDAAGRIYVNTDTERAVMIFSAAGELLASWGKELKGGLHGMTLVREGEDEFLYLAHIGRHEVLKTTLAGEILWTIPWPEASGLYKAEAQFRPTAVAVTADGTIFVADGYGLSYVHQFAQDRSYVRSFGGPGDEPGKMRTPHGLWLDTRGEQPELLVADRENHRLQRFDLEGRHLGVIDGHFRRPCHIHQRGGDLVVADLAGRVTILDRGNELVAHLGDNPNDGQRAQNGIARQDWRDGVFISPHSSCWDAAGNLYVMDWLALGRVTKLRRVAP